MKQNEFTTIFKKLRENKGLTFRSLADSLGISVSYVFDIESGNRAPTQKLIESMIMFYNLNHEQQRFLYDAAAQATDALPYDVVEFLKAHPDELKKIVDTMKVENQKTRNR